jgi:hypothetical protein
MVAIDPNDPRRVVVAYQRLISLGPPYGTDGATRVGARIAWSKDGGTSWQLASGTAAPNYLISGDPSATFDHHGHVFMAYLGFDHTGQAPYWGKGASRNGIFVRRSMDGGATWEPRHTPLIEYPGGSDPPFQDKGYIAADLQRGSPHLGNLYVGWTRYSIEASEILFSRSTDDGASWSAPIVISTEPGVPRGTDGALTGLHLTVGPDGTVYTIWPDGHGIVLAVSRDGGRTFEPSRRIFATTPGPFFSLGVMDFPGGLGDPAIAIDPRTSPGKLFVTWGDYRYGDIDVMVSTSDDGGRTWTAPARVNDDPRHNGKDQVLSWLAVDPSDGAAYVMFYDRRDDPKNLLPTVTLARSTDGGRTFTNYAWTVTASDPKKARYGDYTGLAALNGRVYGVWTENVPKPRKAKASAPFQPAATRVGIADFGSDPRKAGN